MTEKPEPDTKNAPPPTHMAAKAIATLVVLILVLGALIAIGLIKSGVFSEEEKVATVALVRDVAVRRLKKRDVELALSASGEALPFDEVVISAKASGVIGKLLFDEGDHVKRGDLMAEIEHEELQYQVDKAASLVAIAQANLAKTRTPYRPEEVRSLEANVERAKAALEDAKLDRDRASDLWRSRTISQGDWDDAQSQYRIFSAEYTDALEKLNLAKAGGRKEDVHMAEAEVRERQAELNLANQRLSDTKIVSELDGIVAIRSASRGERVNVGSEIAILVDVSKIKVEIYVPEIDFGRVRRGNKARIVLRAFPGKTFSGTVSRKGVSADPKTRTFKIEITVDNPEEKIRPGMTADVTLVWGEEAAVLSIPERALLSGNGERYVYVAQGKVCARRRVTPGLNQHGEVIITDGLEEGDGVIVTGQELLTEGARITIVSED